MVQITTFLTAIAVAIPAVSAVCTCVPGQNYCGYTLLDATHGCQPGDLTTPISDDIFNSLYECNTGGQSATQIEYCGGPGTCQPPQHVGGACDGINACCDA
ncbi:hypothetical protein O1611_g8704 [Lasiodiplodia mahajangana]|uniref:Uncharacterized protein n=1 Tax=Lasiodiplodia mahajangana TaxID=1108764 RepID=A0ACC2JBZ1_9PEZI|nr:hypothetical protein O1611_g8704 [Lasiodiplodia mahajangana]